MLKLQAKSELTNTIEQFIVHVNRNEAHFIYIYVYHTNEFEAANVYKNPPLNVTSPIFFAFFLFHSVAPPMTLLTTGAFTDPKLPAIASTVCTTDAGRVASVGSPPQQKSWLRLCPPRSIQGMFTISLK